MEPILSAIVSDLLGRALSMAIQRYRQSNGAEHKLQQLQHVLLRIDAMVEEAEGRHITNQAMLQQLEMLRQGMYGGHYMLDTFRYRGHGGDDEVVSSGGRQVALSRFSSAKRLLFVPVVNGGTGNSRLDAESVSKLEKMVGGLEMMIGDMVEFAVFLEGYPRICRQPRDTYLLLDKVMFGRQMEKETIINFLLRPEAAAGDGRPGVLPIVGAARVGKSTLVEHVCLDDRVRGHFSSIVFFTGDDLGAGNLAALRRSGVIKHQDRTAAASNGRSLAVIELAGDMDGETWSRLYSSASSNMAHGSKIIITSRSGKIVSLGTARALRLKLLPQEAYWYFFKTLAFGGANPDDHPELASVAMEIAVQLNGLFLGANITATLMRDNLSVQFWRRVLVCLRAFTSKHRLMFGEHPGDRLEKGAPVYTWRIARSSSEIVICSVYQKPSSSSQHDVPKITSTDIIAGSVPQQGEFQAVSWRSNIPPYYTYLASCASRAATCKMASKNKKRSRDARA
ncbi:hypothetical protein ACP70R_038225 [Stipagrostis hirtigluma subsp. patula]